MMAGYICLSVHTVIMADEAEHILYCNVGTYGINILQSIVQCSVADPKDFGLDLDPDPTSEKQVPDPALYQFCNKKCFQKNLFIN
jgi:hypothetical protein